MAQLDFSQSLQRTPIETGGEKFVPHFRLIRLKRPWNKALAIFFTIMTEHAKLDRDMFAGPWVTQGLRVDVNCAPKRLTVSMVPFASLGWHLGDQCGYCENDRAMC